MKRFHRWHEIYAAMDDDRWGNAALDHTEKSGHNRFILTYSRITCLHCEFQWNPPGATLNTED